MSRTLWIALTVLVPTLALASMVAAPEPTLNRVPANGYAVHEWGTFTAVAGADGSAVEWRPLAGPSDLPDFVYTIDKPGLRGSRQSSKSRPGTVRMETPVLYFYSDVARVIDVSVGFPMGQVTEWYPQARSVGSGIAWGKVLVDPDATPALPDDGSDSHYYPARAVDSAPVRVCGTYGEQWERLLFYRGVGVFPLSLEARLDRDLVHLTGRASGRVLLFERQEDRVGVAVAESTSEGVSQTIPRPELDGDVEQAEALVLRELLASGLFPDEAAAMLDTWDDEWFEPGLRVIWVLPRDETDAQLPLQLDPPAAETVRTLVGRLELVPPERVEVLRRILRAYWDVDAAVSVLGHAQGRFAEPALVHLVSTLSDGAERDHAKDVLAVIQAR